MKEDSSIKLKIYTASGFQNRPFLKLVKTLIENKKFSKTVKGKKKNFCFKIHSRWLYENDNEEINYDFDSIIQNDYTDLDNSDLVIGFWPWGAGTVGELVYTIEHTRKPVILFIDQCMTYKCNELNIYEPNKKYYSQMTPFSLMRLHGYGFNENIFHDYMSMITDDKDKRLYSITWSSEGLYHCMEKVVEHYKSRNR